MKAGAIRALLLGGPLLWAAVDARGADPVQFKRDIAPLLKSRCAPCHLTGDEVGGMALHPRAAYKSLVNVASTESPQLRVKPGAPDDSYLIHKLQGTQLAAGGKGLRMPMDGDPLSAADIGMIRSWIAAGAPDN